MAQRRPQNTQVPQFGIVDAGPLNGWRFAFLRFVAVRGRVFTYCRCTPPNWPFPVEVRFGPNDVYRLRAVPGERAKRLDAIALIKLALEVEETRV